MCVGAGCKLSASAIARATGVDCTFLYRHADLLAQLHVARPRPSPRRTAGQWPAGPHYRPTWPTPMPRSPAKATQIRRLEAKLSEILGEQARQECGLGRA